MKDQVYGYIRVSTIRQGLQGVSLQEQKSAIERYAQINQLTVVRWFEERETAAKQGRPIFSKMLKLLRAKAAGGVIIHKIDRSARNLKDWAALGELIDHGIDIHFAHESVDLSARGGRLSADIQAVIATDYIRNLREETIKGIYGRLKQGLYPFRAPLGYLNNGSGQLKTPDPLTAPLIKEAFEIYADGEYSLNQLKDYLTEKGLRHQNGAKITINLLSYMLHNPFYMGIIYIKKSQETFIGNHKPIISKDLFDEVQDVLAGKVKKGPGKHQFLYSRLFKCRVCKHSPVAEKQKGHVYYRCHSRTCKGTSIRQEYVDDAIKKTFADLRFDKSEVQLIDEVLEDLKNEKDFERKDALKRLGLQRSALSDRLDKLTDKYVDGDIDRDIFLRRKKTCLNELKDIEDKILNWESNQKLTYQKMLKKLELSKSLYSGFIQGNDPEKREMVKMYTSNRLVDVKNVLLELESPFRELAQVFNVAFGGPRRGANRTKGKLRKQQLSQNDIKNRKEKIKEIILNEL